MGPRSAIEVFVTDGAGFIGSHRTARRHPAWRLVEADLRDVAPLEGVDFGNNQTMSMIDTIQRPRWSSWVCTSMAVATGSICRKDSLTSTV